MNSKTSYDKGHIIGSLMDLDFYKFTMGQMVYDRYRDVPVSFGFKNRTKKVHLADSVDEGELRDELDHVRSLRFSKSDLHYLRGTNEYGNSMFHEPYLDFLANLRMSAYDLERVDGEYKLEFHGKWSEVTYWETIALSIIDELHYRSIMKDFSRFERDGVYSTGTLNLRDKIKALRDVEDVTFCDFGTRRRFSREWQDYVVNIMAEEMPKQFLGTSNTYLAMKYGLLPMGTSAHELFMGLSGVMHGSDDEIRASHNRVLQDWWDEYGWPLSIALTDTYGSDFFFRDFTPEQAREWKGVRQDSGDPFEFTDKTLDFYRGYEVDPREKLVVYSDGLEVKPMIDLRNKYAGLIKQTFGWGTNLTNDLGFPALSLIVKLIKSNGHGTVKLSDNVAKALGDPKDVERFKRIFGYSETMNEECKY